MIRGLNALTVFNSAGDEMLAAEVTTDAHYVSSAPHGTSKGSREAVELPLSRALLSFGRVREKIIGMDEKRWQEIDALLEREDGTPNFSNLGANVALPISISVARAACNGELWKLIDPHANTFPYPVGNVVGGGAHGGSTDYQEFLVIPERAKSVEGAVRTNIAIYDDIGEILRKKNMLTGRNRENAWMSTARTMRTLDIVSDVAARYGASVGMDVAATQLWDGKNYGYKSTGRKLTEHQHFEYVLELIRKYGLRYVEDPFHENDYESFASLTNESGRGCMVVGDDLYCTSAARIGRGAAAHASNAAIIKPNQAGTLTLALKAAGAAKRGDMACVASHRSHETGDNWLADFAIAARCEYIKAGITGKEDGTELSRLVGIWNAVQKPRMAKPWPG